MVKNFDEFQQFGKENADATMKSFGAVTKGMQAIAVDEVFKTVEAALTARIREPA